MNPKYDFLIVGAGVFGSVCASEFACRGKKCLVIDKRDVIGGNCFTENKDGIHVHKYGAHIFHTNDDKIWQYVNRISKFKTYTHNVIANYEGNMFTLPFNMWTFHQLWGVTDPEDAKKIIDEQRFKGKVTNLEEQALSMVGKDIYETLIKGYTEKQWNKPCSELPASIIKRLPVRFTWDSNYFQDKYTAIPEGGYTQIFETLLKPVEVKLNTDYFENKEYFDSLAENVIYTGPVDRFYDYKFGKLEYRSLRWDTKYLENTDNFQGTPVINYTSYDVPYTRILEHKHFDFQNQKNTIVSYEYSETYDGKNEPYYPIRDEKNTKIYQMYAELTKKETKYLFGGRLGTYTYFDMHQVIAQAIKLVEDYYSPWD